jgi:hypothetical protein
MAPRWGVQHLARWFKEQLTAAIREEPRAGEKPGRGEEAARRPSKQDGEHRGLAPSKQNQQSSEMTECLTRLWGAKNPITLLMPHVHTHV